MAFKFIQKTNVLKKRIKDSNSITVSFALKQILTNSAL
jgi:hypothetical protein